MDYLKKNYSNLLISLYGASNYSTSDADIILEEIRKKLESRKTNSIEFDGYYFSSEGLGKLKDLRQGKWSSL